MTREDEAEPKSEPAPEPEAESQAAPNRPGLNTVQRLELWDREALAPTGFILLLLVASAALIYTVLPFIHDVILAFVVVGLFSPLYRRLQRALANPWLRSAIVTLCALVFVLGPVVWLSLALFEEATNAYLRFRPKLEDGSAVRLLGAFLDRVGISISEAALVQYLDAYASRISEFAIGEAGHLVNNLISAVVHICVIVVLVFYTLVDGDRLKQFLFRLSPLPDEQDQLIVTKFRLVARSVLIGSGTGSLLQGTVGGVAMAIVGLPSPVLWGSVMAIAAFLPLVGVSLVVVPSGVYLMFQGRTAEGVMFMVGCLSLTMIIENVIQTKLVGAGVRVHDVLLFLGILGGLAGFGVLGLLYGPLIVAMFMAFTDLYMTHYRPQFAARFARRKKIRGSLF